MAHVSLRTLIAPPGGKRERAVDDVIGMVEQRAQINHQAWWAEPYIIVCDHEEIELRALAALHKQAQPLEHASSARSWARIVNALEEQEIGVSSVLGGDSIGRCRHKEAYEH